MKRLLFTLVWAWLLGGLAYAISPTGGAVAQNGQIDGSVFALLAGRSSGNDLTIKSTSGQGNIYGSALTGGSLRIAGNAADTTTGGLILAAPSTRLVVKSDTTSQQLLFEDTPSGTHVTSFQAGAQSGDINYTLPTALTTNGLLEHTSSGTLTWLDSTTDFLTQYLKLGGRSTTTNDPTISTGTTGTIYGSNASGGNLTLQSTSHATKGVVKIVGNAIETVDGTTQGLVIADSAITAPNDIGEVPHIFIDQPTAGGGDFPPIVILESHAQAPSPPNDNGSFFIMRRSLGSHASPAQITSGNLLGSLAWQGYDSGGHWAFGAAIEPRTVQDWTSGARGVELDFLTVLASTPTPVNTFTLDSSGNARVLSNLKVGNTSSGPCTSCGLELVSATKALRLSQSSASQVSGLTAAEGMVAYENTNHILEYYNGSAWRVVVSADSSTQAKAIAYAQAAFIQANNGGI